MRVFVLSELTIGLLLVLIYVAGRPLWSGPVGASAPNRLAATARLAWTTDPWPHRVGLLAILIVATWVRLHHLRQPMRLDEASTYLAYASQALNVALSDYSFPNNHLFHTLLVWISTSAFGDAEWVIRLPALSFGLLLVVATYVVARTLGNRDAGLFAAALASGFPSLILYSTNARGYSLLCFLFLVLVLLASTLLENDTRARWTAFAIAVAVGMYTAPIMLYPAGAVCLWMIVERARLGGGRAFRRLAPRLLWSLTIAVLLTAAALAPVVIRSGLSPLLSNRFVTALPPLAFARALPPFARELRESLALGLSLPIVMVLVALALLSFATSVHRDRRSTLLFAVMGWSVLLLVATRRPPFARVWLFLVPLWCIYAAVGLSVVTERIERMREGRWQLLTAIFAASLSAWMAVHTVRRRSIFDSTETGAFKNAPEVARLLSSELQPGDRIAVTAINATPLDYYLRRLANRRLDEFRTLGERGRVYAVVNRQYDQTLDIVRSRQRSVPWQRLELAGTHVLSDATVYTFRLQASKPEARP